MRIEPRAGSRPAVRRYTSCPIVYLQSSRLLLSPGPKSLAWLSIGISDFNSAGSETWQKVEHQIVVVWNTYKVCP